MRFIIISDSKGEDKGINEKVLTKLLKESKKLMPAPELIILGGDNVAGSDKHDILVLQLQNLRRIIANFYPEIKLLPVVGNHEVNLRMKDDSYEKVFREAYRDMLPAAFLEGYNNTVYFTDFGNSRFIVLNSFHSGEFHRIGARQLKWLEEIASANDKNKLLFLHSPAYPTGAHYGHCLDMYPDERNAFLNIVEKCNIKIVFSGHEHNYSMRKIGLEREVYQIISGGAGEKLKDKYKDRQGVITAPIAKYHFVLGDIDTECIDVKAISIDGKIMDEFRVNWNN